MSELLTIARRFAASSRHEINLRDLGIALLLEEFASPALALTTYIPLRSREIMGPVSPDLQTILAGAELAEVERNPEALELIGQGLAHRYRLMLLANRIGLLARAGAWLLYVAICMAIVLAPDVEHAAAILGGWLSALAFTMVVCHRNWHWRPRDRAGVRGSPR